MKIWVDADGCPNAVKEIVFRASTRLQLPVVLVANRPIYTPSNGLIGSVVVPHGLDEADIWIAERVDPEDVVITADIPLAAQIVAKGSIGISPRGELYTEDNVRERLSMRDFMASLREQGIHGSGAPPFDQRAKEQFANALDRTLTRAIRDAERAAARAATQQEDDDAQG